MKRFCAFALTMWLVSSCQTASDSRQSTCNLNAYSFCVELPERMSLESEKIVADFALFAVTDLESDVDLLIYEGNYPSVEGEREVISVTTKALGGVRYEVEKYVPEGKNFETLLTRQDDLSPTKIHIAATEESQNNPEVRQLINQFVEGIRGCHPENYLRDKCFKSPVKNFY